MTTRRSTALPPSDVVGSLFAAIDDDGSAWERALARCRDHLGVSRLSLQVITRVGSGTTWIERRYRAPLGRAARDIETERPRASSDTIAAAHSCDVSDRRDGSMRALLHLGRVGERLERETLERARSLVPYLQRVLTLQRQLRELTERRRLTDALLDRLPVGVCIVDAHRRVHMANAGARALLDVETLVWVDEDGTLRCRDEDERFAAAVAGACRSRADSSLESCITLRGSCDGKGVGLVVEVTPSGASADDASTEFPAHATVTFVDASTAVPVRTNHLSVLYGLSDAESDVLELMLEGLTNRGIAAHRHVGLETVRSQVSSVLRKLGIARRSQLFRLAMIATLPLTAPRPGSHRTDEPKVHATEPSG